MTDGKKLHLTRIYLLIICISIILFDLHVDITDLTQSILASVTLYI